MEGAMSESQQPNAELAQITLQYNNIIRRLIVVLVGGRIRWNKKRNMYYFISASSPLINSSSVRYFSHDISFNIGVHVVSFSDEAVEPAMWSSISKYGYYEEYEVLDSSGNYSTLPQDTDAILTKLTTRQSVNREPTQMPHTSMVVAEEVPPTEEERMADDVYNSIMSRARSAMSGELKPSVVGAGSGGGFKVTILSNTDTPYDDYSGGIGDVPQLDGESDRLGGG
jgi:hypothetical protein